MVDRETDETGPGLRIRCIDWFEWFATCQLTGFAVGHLITGDNVSEDFILKPALPIFVLLIFFRFLVESRAVSICLSAVFIVYGVFLLFYTLPDFKKRSLAIYYLSTLVVLGVLQVLVGGNYLYQGIPQFVAYAGYASSMVNYKMNPRFFEIHFYMYASVFIFLMIRGVNPEDVFSVSRNMISVFVLMTLSVYYISCHQNRLCPSLFVPLLGFVIALWGVGRSGIGSLLIIFLATVTFSGKFFLKKISVLFIMIISFFFIFNLVELDLSSFLVGIERFERLGVDDIRGEINRAYISDAFASVYSLFFGVPLNSIKEIIEMNGNPHSSYIWLHVNFGLIGFLITILVVFFTIINLLLSKFYILLSIFIVVLFRSAFDITAFYGPLDVIILYFIFSSARSINFSCEDFFLVRQLKNHKIENGNVQ